MNENEAYAALLSAVRECDCLDPTREEANEDSAWPYCFECEERWPCSGERLRVLAGWTGRHPRHEGGGRMSQRTVVVCDFCEEEVSFPGIAEHWRIAAPGELVGLLSLDFCSETCLIDWMHNEADRRAKDSPRSRRRVNDSSRPAGNPSPSSTPRPQ